MGRLEATPRVAATMLSTGQEEGGRQETGALQRGLALLEQMVQAGRPMTLVELAERSELHPSTVHRLLQALVQTGHVMRDAAKRYAAGPKAYLPLSLYHPLNVLRRDSFETLSALRDRFGVTCGLTLFLGTERLVVDVAMAGDSLSPFYETQLSTPLHASATGKLLLMNLAPAARAALLGPAPYPRHTARTITEEAALAEDLARCAERGWTVCIDENFEGISALGAPIRLNADRAIGALAFAGPTRHFTPEQVPAMGEAACRAAELLAYGSPGVKAVRPMLGW